MHSRAPARTLALPLLLIGVLAFAACAETPDEQDASEEAQDSGGQSDAGDGGKPEPPEGFPDRPIELTVAYDVGGGVDVAARAFASAAEDVLGWDFTVENRTGAGGMIAHTYIAHEASPDGYTIGVLSNPFFFEDILIRDGEFIPEDFAPIANLNYEPIALAVRADSDIGTTFDEIIKYAEENPQELEAGINPNNAYEFVTEFVEDAHDVEFNKVGFDGGAEGVAALLAGDIDMTATVPTEIQDQVKAGKLEVVAVTDQTEVFPDAPSYPEVGVKIPKDTYGANRFFAVPEETDPEVKEYLEWGLLKAMRSPEMKRQFEKSSIPLVPQDSATTEESYWNFWDRLEGYLRDTGRIE